ncbi:MAG TPA: type III-B CRISPR module-associated protein Cmr3 [Bacilli bacterium]|nr:type III-B CRISPR module-associated protein Cmr3 [Bacilli bacterium]
MKADHWQGYEIRPLDSVFFRGGEPFARGDTPFLKSLFPPSPQLLQGLVRSTVLQQTCADLKQFGQGCARCAEVKTCQTPMQIGEWKTDGRHLVLESGTMRLRGPFLTWNGRPIFPLPVDCLATASHVERMDTRSWSPSTVRGSREKWQTDLAATLDPVFRGGEQGDTYPGYMTWEGLQNYLLGEARFAWGRDVLTSDDVFTTEGKTGIALDDHRLTEEGMIYTVEMVRLRPEVSFYFEARDVSLASQVTTWGGEGRLVHLQQCEGNQFHVFSELKDRMRERILESGGFRLLLLQPLHMAEVTEWERELELQTGYPFECRGMRTVQPLSLGGWDLVKRRPKSMQTYLPAGSVLYFSWSNKNSKIEAALRNLVDAYMPGTLASGQDAENGFGQTVIGAWKHE